MIDDVKDSLRAELIAEIEAAFQNVQRGGGLTLFEAHMEGVGSEADFQRARAREIHATWRDVPDKVIARCYSALSFLDPEGFRYYLPAYMRFAVRYFDDPKLWDEPAVDWAIYAFRGYESFREYKEPLFSIFDEPQARVICRFLRFMANCTNQQADDEAAREALQSYWGRFCEGAK
jgi:hypothetical protein